MDDFSSAFHYPFMITRTTGLRFILENKHLRKQKITSSVADTESDWNHLESNSTVQHRLNNTLSQSVSNYEYDVQSTLT